MSTFWMNITSLKMADICIIGLVVLWAVMVLLSGFRKWKRGKAFGCGCCGDCSKCAGEKHK